MRDFLSVLGVLLLLLLSSLPAQGSNPQVRLAVDVPTVPQQAPLHAYPVNPSSLTLSGTAIDLSPHFWGGTVSPEARLLPDEGNLLNATPARVFVWPGGDAGDDYLAPPLNGTLYDPSTGLFHLPSTNESSFVDFCRSIHCTAIFQVPGEINDSAVAASIVRYTETTLGFHPWAWEIGNEPERWAHTSLPWTQWQNGVQSNESPDAYAWEVNRYSVALRAVDPAIRILGLPGTGRPQNGGPPLNDWLNATVQINGPNLSGVAFHDYPGLIYAGEPGSGSPLQNLSLFYAAIQSSAGLGSRVTSGRSTIANQTARFWPGTPAPPIVVTEIGSGLSNESFGVTNFSSGFPGALSLAAQLTQAMSLNLSNIDIFQCVFDTSNSWFDLQGNPRPDYALYADVLNRLGPIAFNATFSGFNGTLYAVGTFEATTQGRSDLLTVNTNLTTGAQFAPRLPYYTTGSPVEVWSWNGTFVSAPSNGGDPVNATTALPVGQFFPGGLPSSWVLPPQSLALFESFNAPSAPVVATQMGLAPSARWFLQIGSETLTAANPSLTTLLPSGPYPLYVPPLNVTGQHRNASFAPGRLAVGSTPLFVRIPYAEQWWTNLTVSPAGAGLLSPVTGWWNASAPLVLNVTAAGGYLFDRWVGSGPGSYSGPGTYLSPYRDSIDLAVRGALSERAVLTPGWPVSFQAAGLPAHASWSVAVHYLGNFTEANQSGATSMAFVLPVGKWGYSVDGPPGYTALPAAGAVNVTGTPGIIVSIQFSPSSPKTPPWIRLLPLPVVVALVVAVGLGVAAAATLMSDPRRRRAQGRAKEPRT